MSFIYFVSNKDGQFKIGFARDVSSRMVGLQTACAQELNLLGSIPGDPQLEKAIHRHFNRWHIYGEWFRETQDSLEEVGRILADPPAPLGIVRGKRRLTKREDIILAERIAGYFRGRHPRKPSSCVSAETGIEETTIRTWLQGNSLPNAEMMTILWLTYGPTFLAALVSPVPQWLQDAVKRERAQQAEAEIRRLQDELEVLRKLDAEASV